MNLDPAKIAWAAGIIEGEGCIHSAVRKYRSPAGGPLIMARVRVVMSDADIVERVRDVFGVGNVLTYRNTQGLGKKQLYRWDAGSRADVLRVCDAIYPWMGERRRAAIDRLRALSEEHPPVSMQERLRRTWATRRAKAAAKSIMQDAAVDASTFAEAAE